MKCEKRNKRWKNKIQVKDMFTKNKKYFCGPNRKDFSKSTELYCHLIAYLVEHLTVSE